MGLQIWQAVKSSRLFFTKSANIKEYKHYSKGVSGCVQSSAIRRNTLLFVSVIRLRFFL